MSESKNVPPDEELPRLGDAVLVADAECAWKLIDAQTLEVFGCAHEHTEWRRGTNPHGPKQIKQCLECGAESGRPNWDVLPDPKLRNFDPALREAWLARLRAYHADLGLQYLGASRGGWRSYGQYLDSEPWARRRNEVLDRDQRRCQARVGPDCSGVGTEVHHLTYAHVYNEPLFDLIAVCRACHQRLGTDGSR